MSRCRPLPPFLLGLLAFASTTGCASLVPYEQAVDQLPAGEFVTVDGVEVHIERSGPTDGEPVVLVHGFGGSTYSWRHVLPVLAQDYDVVAVDLFGFGLTERPANKARYTRTAQVELLSSLLDELGFTSAHFVGHSYGGGLVLSLAHARADKVRSMVLVDSTAPDYGDRRRNLLARRPLADLFVRTLLRPRFVKRSLRRSFYDDDEVTRELVDAYLERVRIEGAIRAYIGLTAPAPPDPRFSSLKFEELIQPTLAVWGSNDVLITAADGRSATERMPNSRFVEIPDCGHVPMEEAPERLVAEMRDFLDEVTASD